MHQGKDQAMVNVVKGPTTGDKATPMLDRHPPLPKAAPVRIINQYKEEFNMKREIVPMMSYSNDQMSLPSNGIIDPLRERAPIVNF